MEDKMVYDLLVEIRKDQKEHSKELAQQSKCLIAIQKDVEVNTRDLTEHKEGVIQNRGEIRANKKEVEKLRKECEEAIEELKEPAKFKKWLYNKYIKYIMVAGGIVSLATGLTKLFGLW